MDKDPQIANKEKEQSQKPLIKVGLTVGDINGIGPEVLIKALKDNRSLTDLIPVIYGSNKFVSFYKKSINYKLKNKEIYFK
jgi:4-hydroxythreonine-4-phosphate dehydrogenase